MTNIRKPISRIAFMALAGIGVFGLGTHFARANTITYQISNVNGGDGTGSSGLNANFVFNISAGQISVTINNTTQDTASDGEEIYGLSFDLTDATGHAVSVTSNPTYTLTNGTEVTITNTGVKGKSADWQITNSSSVTESTMSKPWLISGSGNGVSMHIDTSKPNDLVIAPPPNPKDYGSNDGLNSVYQHNPSLLSGATFNLDIANALAGDKITNVVIAYGTTPDYIDGTPVGPGGTPFPEPASFSLLAIPAVALLLRKKCMA